MPDKREQILVAAENLFAEKGFDATSVRELAKKAGVNIAMISYYFGSKEKLFESVVEYRTSYMRGKLQLLNQNEVLDPMAKIELVIDYYVDRIFSARSFHKILHREMMLKQRNAFHSNIAEILLRNAMEVKKIIREGQRKGYFRKVDAELVMVSVIGTITQCTMSEMLAAKLLRLNNEGLSSPGYKKRLKKYLKDLMRSYLFIKNKEYHD